MTNSSQPQQSRTKTRKKTRVDPLPRHAKTYLHNLDTLRRGFGVSNEEFYDLFAITHRTGQKIERQARRIAYPDEAGSKPSRDPTRYFSVKHADRSTHLLHLLQGNPVYARKREYSTAIESDMSKRGTEGVTDFSLVSYLHSYEALSRKQASAAMTAALIRGARLRYFAPTMRLLREVVEFQVPTDQIDRWIPNELSEEPLVKLVASLNTAYEEVTRNSRALRQRGGYIEVYEFDTPLLPLALREKITWDACFDPESGELVESMIIKERIRPGEFDDNTDANYFSEHHDWMRARMPLDERGFDHALTTCRGLTEPTRWEVRSTN